MWVPHVGLVALWTRGLGAHNLASYSMEVTMKRRWRSVLPVLVATCLLATGCASEWERRMQALREDPMASASWEGLELLGNAEVTNNSPKPPPPSITRCYKLHIPVEKAIATVLTTAGEHGWIEDPSVKRKGGAVAQKTTSGSSFSLIVSDFEGSCKDCPDFGLRITLGYM